MNIPRTVSVPVWDLLVRLFHWSLVVAFATAYLSGEYEVLDLHALAGYVVGGLILFRVFWGFAGPEHARFRDFVFPPATILAYTRDLFTRQARRYLGHNPLGGAMVVALLILLALATVTDLMAYGAEKHAGLLRDSSKSVGGALEEIHEFFSTAALVLVGLHIAGVALSSWLHRENLVRAMVTGRKHP